MPTISSYDMPSLQQEVGVGGASTEFFLLHFHQHERINFEPHRTEAYAVCLLHQGELRVETDLFPNHFVGPAVFVIAPTVIRQFSRTDGSFDAHTLFFDQNFLLKSQADVTYLERFDFLHRPDQHVVPLSPAQHEKFNTYYQLVAQTIRENTAYTPAIVRSLLYILLHEVAAAHEANRAASPPAFTHNQQLLFTFKNLLARDHLRHRHVSYYAQLLHITPKHFSTVIKAESGKTAGEWIDEMVLLEAKVLLQQKELTIAQVADKLHFNDQSTFGKFFKNLAGISPLEYRKGLTVGVD
ncbi:helix-turn-helix domain-containing protein [Hymenobacter monticola]|uniref:Helix-turn-helix transcriptional regulator n=1 Tax=Hymenobacter monticola TaxID=1705399 RepID=A0ABY4BFJ3_9BACT|nr:helix-turn-helix transcriptional regulator [Hymenobacter monticola]UOE36511.1 helix-turn-helix transcriptional regulator [Hymenobacter monticola]